MPRREGLRRSQREARPGRPIGPTLLKALGLYRPHLLLLFTLLGLVAVNSMIGLLPPLIIREVVDGAFKRSDGSYLDQLILMMLAVVVVSTLLGVAQAFASQVLGMRVVFDLRGRMYRHLAAMPLQWFTSSRSGETISRINNDVGGVQGVVSDVLSSTLGNVINLAVTFTVMAYIDWKLALFCVAFMPLFIWPSRKIGEIQYRITRDQQAETAKLQAHMQETLSVSGALLVKTFGREEHEAQEFEKISLRVRQLQRAGGRMLPAAQFLPGFPVAAGTPLALTPMPPLVGRGPFPRAKG